MARLRCPRLNSSLIRMAVAGAAMCVAPSAMAQDAAGAPPADATESSETADAEETTDAAETAEGTDAEEPSAPAADAANDGPGAPPAEGAPGEPPASAEHFHGEALHDHLDGDADHHHHGGRLTHDHQEGEDWHHHHGDDVAHDHEGTERPHHHHGEDDDQGHDHDGADDEHDHLAESLCPEGIPCWTEGGFAMWPRGRIIAGYEFVQPDPNALFVGENDGFLLEQARIGLQANWRNRLGFVVVYDAITPLPNEDVNEVVADVFAGIRDAYLVYQPVAPLKMWLGQLYMPADIESQTSRAELNFTSRSVMSGGVRAGRGYQQDGLSVIRETGFIIGNDDYVPFSIGKNEIGFDYRFALSNGNGTNVLGNDNKLPQALGRLGARYGDYLRVGFGGSYNPRTRGVRPNLFLETEARGFADITFDMFGIRAVATSIFQWTTFDSILPEADPNRTQAAYGAAAWVSVEDPFGLPTFGLRPAVRVSYYEPNSAFDEDQLFETTFAVRYIPPTGLPLALLFDVTLLFEPGPANQRQIDNHRATALAVFNF